MGESPAREISDSNAIKQRRIGLKSVKIPASSPRRGGLQSAVCYDFVNQIDRSGVLARVPQHSKIPPKVGRNPRSS